MMFPSILFTMCASSSASGPFSDMSHAGHLANSCASARSFRSLCVGGTTRPSSMGLRSATAPRSTAAARLRWAAQEHVGRPSRSHPMDQHRWPDIVMAILASLVFVGLPGLLIALTLLG
jgi:hypothetical protein